MLEMKSFGEVDLSSMPIVVLGCGHFFTGETLDGHIGMGEVYDMDLHGDFVGLRDITGELAQSVPRCPDCQRPIRQYVTQRYNRVINRAAVDEMSKRFLESGTVRLQALEGEVIALELYFEKSRQGLKDILNTLRTQLNPVRSVEVTQQLESRYDRSKKLAKAVATFLNSVSENHQPVRKLHDATVKAIRARQPINEEMEQLTLDDISKLSPDRRVVIGGRAVQLKVELLILVDKFELVPKLESISGDSAVTKTLGGDPAQLATLFFKSCEELVADCGAANLTKLNVETRLHYGRIARLYQPYSFATKSVDTNEVTKYIKYAKDLLEEAKEMCILSFQNADGLRTAVEDTLRLFGKEWYEPVSAEELAAIKAAMVSGPRGIATHSGHWYKCQNGHPVSFLRFGAVMRADR